MCPGIGNMSHKKRHHILPQRYQKGFADLSGRVWYYDRRRGHIACENPLNVAVETNFYTSESTDSPNPAFMEDFLAEHIESPFWPVLETLEKRQIPSSEDRQRVSVFAAFLLTRVVAFRDALTKILGDVMLTSNNLAATMETVPGLFEMSKDGLFIPKMPKNHALNQMGRLGIEATKILLTLNNHFMYSPANEPFITSDNPFVFDKMVNIDEPPSVGAHSYLKWVPLSARVAVGFGLPGNNIFMSEMNVTQVKQANLRFATAARQIIIATTKHQLEEVLSIIPKNPPGSATAFPSAI